MAMSGGVPAARRHSFVFYVPTAGKQDCKDVNGLISGVFGVGIYENIEGNAELRATKEPHVPLACHGCTHWHTNRHMGAADYHPGP